MSTHPLVLIACAPAEMPVLRALVPPQARVVTAASLDAALERVRQGVDAVICSVQFDDSRMLELVREAHRQCPEVPVLCCRLPGDRMRDASLRAAATAALSVGVAAFTDLGGDVAGFVATLVRLLG